MGVLGFRGCEARTKRRERVGEQRVGNIRVKRKWAIRNWATRTFFLKKKENHIRSCESDQINRISF